MLYVWQYTAHFQLLEWASDKKTHCSTAEDFLESVRSTIYGSTLRLRYATYALYLTGEHLDIARVIQVPHNSARKMRATSTFPTYPK